jgi:hypothetical protein
MEEKFTLAQIKGFCDEYDDYNGAFPESKYGGASVYEHIVERLEQQKAKNQEGAVNT